ncbi:MAG: hypothetical protein ABUT39_18930, partial [Acidobacteriota bacterium]
MSTHHPKTSSGEVRLTSDAPSRGSFEELVLLESIRNGLWQASFQRTFLQEAGAADGLFLLPALFDEALP